ncbi:PTS transporter subunit EIIC, partial [Klebsiella pneumoniae]|uniref:PTS transporter subunit EIIC n=1 Tax=Klebsiella pneumoniae TaxID=573 RepID=UPI00210CF384
MAQGAEPGETRLFQPRRANFSWLPAVVSHVMAEAGGSVFANMPLIFAIGVALGFTNNDGWVADPLHTTPALAEIQYCYVNGRMMRDRLIN